MTRKCGMSGDSAVFLAAATSSVSSGRPDPTSRIGPGQSVDGSVLLQAIQIAVLLLLAATFSSTQLSAEG